jgi:hypothetical protein
MERESNPHHQFGRLRSWPLNDIRVGPAGIEPACAGFQPAANPSQLETHGREAGTRTPSTASQTRRANPYTTSRSSCRRRHRWRRPESNRLRRRLRGVSATLAVIPVELTGLEPVALCMPCKCSGQLSYSPIYGAAPGTALSPGVAWLSSAAPLGRGRMAPAADAHAMVFSMCKHVHPQVVPRWDGRIRTCGARLWRPPLSPLSYIPLQLSGKRKPPVGVGPWGRLGCPACWPYTPASPPVRMLTPSEGNIDCHPKHVAS